MHIDVGSPAPDFTLSDQRGEPWSLSAHRGQPVVLYFYPRADTPGCTTQACDVRDAWSAFTDLGAVVAGISPDEVEAIATFAGKYALPHPLLSDPDHEAISAYGAWGRKSISGTAYDGVIRSSVVVGPDGSVAATFPGIDAADQTSRTLPIVRELVR